MVGLSTADGITVTLVGLAIFIALVVAWRTLVHDRAIRRIRFGVFYERERDEYDDGEEDEDNSNGWTHKAAYPPGEEGTQ